MGSRKLSFVVPGIPMGKKRHRSVPLQQCLQCQKTIQGQYKDCPECHGALRFIKNLSYADSESVKYENLVSYVAREAMLKAGMEEMFSRPLRVDITFTFPIPQSRRCSKHLTVVDQVIADTRKTCKKLHPGDPHGQKPDRDNGDKSILDGCVGTLLVDDCIVADGRIRKQWGVVGQAEVEMEEM